MFRIGEFSRIGSVTIETLRHYDALGLLKPAQVDPVTGYRFYSAKQLHPLNQILALKEVGFSLEEIGRILDDKLTAVELSDMLKAQLAITERALEAANLRRAQIVERLRMLEHEHSLPPFEVTLKKVDPLTIASIRERVPTAAQVPERWHTLFSRLVTWLNAKRLPLGIPMTLYHNAGYALENIDTECAIILPHADLATLPDPDPPIRLRHIPAIPQAACTIVADESAESHRLAYKTLGLWIEEHNYTIIGPPRELYFGAPENGDYTAEIQFPVERRS